MRLPACQSLKPFFLLASVLAAVGCKPLLPNEVCSHNCRLDIVLPEASDQPPQAPAIFQVTGNQSVDFHVNGSRPALAGTIISLDQAAFEEETGSPTHTVKLITGSNPVQLRSFMDGVCHPPRGCRYMIINTGLVSRPPRNGDPRLVIYPDAASDEPPR